MNNSKVMFIFLFLIRSIFSSEICSKKSKLYTEDKIWNLDQLEYVELDGDFHIFSF